MNEETKTTRRAIRNQKQPIKNCDDLILRTSELENSKIHYEKDKIVLKDRKTEFDIKMWFKIKNKRIRQGIENMKHNGVRCDFVKLISIELLMLGI